jgi:hypothetical protein
VIGQTSGTATFTFDLTGLVAYDIAYGRAQFGFSAGNDKNSATGYTLYRQATDGATDIPLQPTLTFTLPYGPNGSLNYYFDIAAQINCYVLSNPHTLCDGNSTLDFRDAIKLVHLDVYDSAGNLVINPTITSDSGTHYADLTATSVTPQAPEPGTFCLFLGSGFLLASCNRLRSRFAKQEPIC